jgi:hypothetical protein
MKYLHDVSEQQEQQHFSLPKWTPTLLDSSVDENLTKYYDTFMFSLPTYAELLSTDAFRRNVHSHPQPSGPYVIRVYMLLSFCVQQSSASHLIFTHPHFLPTLSFWPMADYAYLP